MEITYLGHAGFLIETSQAILVTDPWFSTEGAFDSAWFQFPCNHDLASVVRSKIRQAEKPAFVYVSHEHRDHFDPEFLKTLSPEKITFLVPKFNRPHLREELARLNPMSVVASSHAQGIEIPGGIVKIYLDDSGLNRDSAILLKADNESFLNLNDCKLYDEVSSIRASEGSISVLTCQFSGATWHPTCYEYEPGEYQRISRQKLLGKFEMVARAIEAVGPRVYLPSAGPACFLDPALLHLNFEPVNIFPRAPQFLDFLGTRLQKLELVTMEIMPGDKLDSHGWRLETNGRERISEENFVEYIHNYASRYRILFAGHQSRYTESQYGEILDGLQGALQKKLDAFEMHERITVPLYFILCDFGREFLLVDFPRRKVERVSSMQESDFYSLGAPAWQIARILDRFITWEEFALTFRMRLNRKPDVYQTLIQGFLLMEPEDMNWFCARLLEIEQRGKRIIVEANGSRYSIDRFCPHQGADLSQGWLAEGNLWTCPRHRWQFCLDKEGRCTTSTGSIHAVPLEND